MQIRWMSSLCFVAWLLLMGSLTALRAPGQCAGIATDPAAADPAPAGPHTANGITETVLAGDQATSVEAAVTAANPGATIDRMETDADGDTFEAHITLADGSHATVKLDASFAITSTDTNG